MAAIDRLLGIMRRLRDPQQGCPWDLQQDFRSIAPYTIEEAYEVTDAIERGSLQELRGELGDLLFQVVFHSQLAQEQGAFSFDDVVAGICDKMERRHPHVFGAAEIADADTQSVAWEELKRREREAAGQQNNVRVGVLAGVPVALPALSRASKLGKRAAQVGFEWPDIHGALDKVGEEINELRVEVDRVQNDPANHESPNHESHRAALEDELGDVLFSIVNVARYLKIDPERALRGANAKFERRFGYVEAQLHQRGTTPAQSTLEEMDELWEEGKREERGWQAGPLATGKK
jgi:tetrapyrrole methylase family protein/MazG family protein/ATP diphosphatase